MNSFRRAVGVESKIIRGCVFLIRKFFRNQSYTRKVNFVFNSGGSVLVMTLVFVTMFLVIFIGLSGLVTRSYHESVLQSNDELAFQIAEDGLNYARWRLAHNPSDFSTEIKNVDDQFAGTLGSFEITMVPPPSGSTIVEITSEGATTGFANREVILGASYGRPSLARFSSITNGDVWYGGPINGPVHANGGIRMDGDSNSLMSSAVATYPCQPYHGCSSPFQTQDGVWGSGTIQQLWDFPVAQVDYASLTLDLLDMRTAAQATGTFYGPSGVFGYQIVMNSDNTYTISNVTAKGPNIWSWTNATGWQFSSHDTGTVATIETRAIPSNGIIYVEDDVWVQGDVVDRVTVAAGVFPDTPATNVDIFLNGNISYGGVVDGSRAFAAVAQRDMVIPWSGAPDDMILDGAFVAQQGSFHRRYYLNSGGAQPHALKNSLTRFGMIASNGVPTTAWVDGGGNVESGFQTGSATYDTNLLYQPPPYFPSNGQYEFISWEEVQ